MGMLSKIARVIRSFFGSSIEAAEKANPTMVARQAVQDLKDKRRKITESSSQAIAAEKRLLREIEGAKGKAQEYREAAKVALQSGRKDDAKRLLEEALRQDNVVAQLSPKWEAASHLTQRLKDQLLDFNRRIEDAERDVHLISVGERSSEALQAITKVAVNFDDDGAFETIDRMKTHVLSKQDEVDAMMELEGEMGAERAVEGVEKLKLSTNADAELLKMEKELGLLEAPKQKE